MDFKELVGYIIESILSPITNLILALAIVYFLWNVFQFIKNSDSEEARAKFKSQAVWGVIAIAVMVSLWGLVAFFTNTFGTLVDPSAAGIVIPQLRY